MSGKEANPTDDGMQAHGGVHPSAASAASAPEVSGPEAPAKASFPVVAVGASAGALPAFVKLLSALPDDCGMAFILIPHLAPEQKSLMVELLENKTPLAVTEIVDGEAIEVNHIYVIPPGYFLGLQHGRLQLLPPQPQQQTPIDYFFYALAKHLRERSIAIVLSGTGSHGSSGLKQIKLEGGLVLAQRPDTAEFEQMPHSAIATGLVDGVLAPEQMAGELKKYAACVSQTLSQGVVAGGDGAAMPLTRILTLLRRQTKLDFRCYRKGMLLRRIHRRMGLVGAVSLDDYLHRLHEQPEELQALYRDMLINVSAFFREPEAFEVLKQRVIPELVEGCDDDRPVRAWVPGCATGEEAWTLAILLLEAFEACGKTPLLQVFATDIDEQALKIGRSGVYPPSISLEVSPARLQRFFDRQANGSYKVNQELQSLVVFAQQNLVGDAPFSQLDLISCRNLLIYLKQDIQQKVIALFHFSLKPGGCLVLGPSESVRGDSNLFQPISRKWRIFRRLDGGRRRLVDLPFRAAALPTLPKYAPLGDQVQGTERTHLMHATLLAKCTPASVLIDRQYQVQCFHGATSDYLQIPAGAPTQNLFAMAREGLRTRLRLAIHRAFSEQQVVVDEDARVLRNGHYMPCRLTFYPLPELHQQPNLMLVTFADRSAAPAVPGTASDTVDDDGLIQQLEYELNVTREELQGNIEALEVSNEELKASNEEAMSMNEEMQSANEELESAKEELQSLNEELTTVNGQLQEKLEELQVRNNDIANLLASTNIGTLFLDLDLRIKLFTPPIRELLNLLDQDIGRPFSDFSPKFRDLQLLSDCHQVLDQLIVLEKEVDADTGRCYLRRAAPYRTQDNRIGGVVITFVDISLRKQADAQSRRLAQVLRDSNDAIIVQDLNGVISAWNRGAENMYGYSEAEALGLEVSHTIPPLQRTSYDALIRRLVRGKGSQASLETQRRRKDGRVLDIWITLTCVTDEAGDVVAVASTERDISARKQMEQELRKLNQELEKRIEQRTAERLAVLSRLASLYRTAPVGLCSLDQQLRFLSVNEWLPAAVFGSSEHGLTAESMIGHKVEEVAPHLASAIKPLLLRVLANGEAVNHYEIMINEDGSEDQLRILTCNCGPIECAADGPQGLSLALQDVTDQKRTLNALRAEKERITSILDTAVDAILSIDAGGLIQNFNLAAEKLFGYQAAEMIGSSFAMLIPVAEKPAVYLERYAARRQAAVVGHSPELQGRRKDGSGFPLIISVGEVDHSHCYTVSIRDISAQKALQQELLSIAEQTQMNIGQALHDDIGQEMTALALKAETLQLQCVEKVQRDLAANIVAALDRTRKRIRTLSHSLLPVVVDAKGLGHALTQLAAQTRESYSISCTFNAAQDIDVLDSYKAGQLYHIAREAITNSLRHGQANNIRIVLKRRGRMLFLGVRDDGVGLGAGAENGTGSGINIMRYRAELISGQLRIGRAVTGGTRVLCCVEDTAEGDAQGVDHVAQ